MDMIYSNNQVCGDVGCCYTPWLQGTFVEGGEDYFEIQDIGECGKFIILQNEYDPRLGNTKIMFYADSCDLLQNNIIDFHKYDDIYIISEITIYHQGTDAIGVKYVRVETTDNRMYACSYPDALIDHGLFSTSHNCSIIQKNDLKIFLATTINTMCKALP